MQRRVKKIPFLNVIKNSKAEDTSLPEKLRAEAPGILNWAIRGWVAYQKHGLQEPAIVQRETSEYIKSLDTTAQFIEEECEVGAAFEQPAGELYQRYRAWIDGRGQKALGSPRFRTDLQAKGYRWDSTKQGSFWHGLRLSERVEDGGR
jgi:putative DNA primase/helicase